jgi:hypothetical protein
MIFQFIPRSLRFYEDLKNEKGGPSSLAYELKSTPPIIRFALEAPRPTDVALIYPIGFVLP